MGPPNQPLGRGKRYVSASQPNLIRPSAPGPGQITFIAEDRNKVVFALQVVLEPGVQQDGILDGLPDACRDRYGIALPASVDSFQCGVV